MDLALRNRVVVITGGSAGIGKACARGFLQEGCHVAVCGRSPEKLNAVQQEFAREGYEITTGVADATNAVEMSAFAEKVTHRYGGIDIWLNNAGTYMVKDILSMTGEEWDELFRQNVKSVFIGSGIAAGHMKNRGRGVILNASSHTALFPPAGVGAYAATKAAVSSLTRTLAGEWASDHIRVIAYAPAVVITEMTEAVIAVRGEILAAQTVLNRLAEPKEIADCIVFLASDSAGYMTGITVEISGGKFCVQNPQYSWNR